MSFLLEVSKNNHQGVLKALTETPEDIKQTDKNGNTALHIASEKGLHQMVEILIEHGAKLNSQNKCPGWTAAHFAAYEGHAEILQLLLESGAKPDVKDWQGDTAETWALDWENYKCAMLFMSLYDYINGAIWEHIHIKTHRKYLLNCIFFTRSVHYLNI